MVETLQWDLETVTKRIVQRLECLRLFEETRRADRPGQAMAAASKKARVPGQLARLHRGCRLGRGSEPGQEPFECFSNARVLVPFIKNLELGPNEGSCVTLEGLRNVLDGFLHLGGTGLGQTLPSLSNALLENASRSSWVRGVVGCSSFGDFDHRGD
jgi:hypothetical protein